MMRVLASFEAGLAIGVCIALGGPGLPSRAHADEAPTMSNDARVVDHHGGYQRHRATSGAVYGMHRGHGSWSHLPNRGHRHHGQFGRHPGSQPNASNGGWFQRPYPYHLDYYKMRYGGTYEPYFGNLYGPPMFIMPPAYAPGFFPNGFYR